MFYIIGSSFWGSICPHMVIHEQVPSSQRRVHFSWSEADRRDLQGQTKAIVLSREESSSSSVSRFVEHILNFDKIWSSEQQSKGRCTLCKKKVRILVIVGVLCFFELKIVV